MAQIYRQSIQYFMCATMVWEYFYIIFSLFFLLREMPFVNNVWTIFQVAFAIFIRFRIIIHWYIYLSFLLYNNMWLSGGPLIFCFYYAFLSYCELNIILKVIGAMRILFFLKYENTLSFLLLVHFSPLCITQKCLFSMWSNLCNYHNNVFLNIFLQKILSRMQQCFFN